MTEPLVEVYGTGWRQEQVVDALSAGPLKERQLQTKLRMIGFRRTFQLYKILQSLIARGLVSRVEEDGQPRRYGLTPLGAAFADEEEPYLEIYAGPNSTYLSAYIPDGWPERIPGRKRAGDAIAWESAR